MKLFNIMSKQHWLEDESEALIELWNLCDYDSQKELILSLLKRFNFLTSRDTKKYCEDISNHICDFWKITNKSTKIVALNDDDSADGSLYIIQAIKNKFANRHHWTENNFKNNLKTFGEAKYQLRNGQNLIIIDDFIGSGKTVCRRITRLKDQIALKRKKNIKIYLVSLACMEYSIPYIKNINIDFYAPLKLKKGISDYYKPSQVKKYIGLMLKLESYLSSRYNGRPLPSLGYNKSESLYSIEGVNLPNNVFPIFWWPMLKDNSPRKTIFKQI
jgi:hypoxanthine phosphoribosyltransferase